MSDVQIGIGSTVWVFDVNRRVYPQPEPGRLYSAAPIYREHFRPVRVVGENRVSWILDNDQRVNKKTLSGIYPTQQSVDDACWVHDHGWKIMDALRRVSDAGVLRQVAALIKLEVPDGAGHD